VTELAEGSPGAATGDVLALPRSVRADVALAGVDRGIATHLVLRHLNLDQPCRGDDLEAQIDRIAQRRLISPEQAAAVDRSGIEWFLWSTELGRRIRAAPPGDVWREVPFAWAVPPERFGVGGEAGGAAGGAADQPMVRGRIDLLVREGQTYLVVDYKTDHVAAVEVEARREDYQTQMTMYREAIRSICGTDVCEVHLVFLTPRVIY
jgi:ATP-dependent helicase/nuclease subunit A